ncbi:hypothetical protein [Rossellomorea vietnamensis]|uniref:hypothetical protein n=1 Tax=Rossellomorea vietnamensis TaxID=218284 RepID=UPI00054E5D5F|nr:hypothetical protein [Rossellomorea vietnamensis]
MKKWAIILFLSITLTACSGNSESEKVVTTYLDDLVDGEENYDIYSGSELQGIKDYELTGSEELEQKKKTLLYTSDNWKLVDTKNFSSFDEFKEDQKKQFSSFKVLQDDENTLELWDGESYSEVFKYNATVDRAEGSQQDVELIVEGAAVDDGTGKAEDGYVIREVNIQ